MPRPSFKRIFKIIGITAVVGFSSLVLLVAAALSLWIKVDVPHCQQVAEERWAAIGRPMPKFARGLKAVAENDSFRALPHDLQPFGVKTFYKAREGEQNPNSINVPKQITDVIDPANSPEADQIDLSSHDLSYLDQHAADLDRLYQGILQRELAVWSFVPQDGMGLRVPSYLTARYMSQLIWVDALHKLERGDQKEAADAVAAGLKMTSNIGEQPILISQMIRVAIDGLYAQIVARLPEDREALKHLATEVGAKREMWRTALQTETWAVMNVIDYAGMKPDQFSSLYETASPIRKFYIS